MPDLGNYTNARFPLSHLHHVTWPESNSHSPKTLDKVMPNYSWLRGPSAEQPARTLSVFLARVDVFSFYIEPQRARAIVLQRHLGLGSWHWNCAGKIFIYEPVSSRDE